MSLGPETKFSVPHLPLRFGAALLGHGSVLARFDGLGRVTAPLVGLLALALGGCATQQDDAALGACNPQSVACNPGSNAGGGTAEGGGTNVTSGGSSSSGDTSTGGAGGLDNGAAGTASGAGGAPSVGSAGMMGSAGGASGATNTNGGGAGTGVTAAGAGGAVAGAGGMPATGGSLGTAGALGSAGAAAGGSAGAGGAPNALCTTAIPVRSSWVATASVYSNACTVPSDALCNPPAYAIDADPTTRFSTGTKQVGTEWLQIDLGASGTVDQVTLSVSNGDYGRHIQIRMSNTANDAAAPVLVEQDGMTGLQAFKFTPKTARYILISQTGMLMTGEISWWSVQDATVTCN